MRWEMVAGLTLAAGLMIGTAGARGSSIIANGSTFGVGLLDNGATTSGAITFDGTAQTFAGFNGGTVTVAESQVDNGNGTWTIDVHLTSTQDMFPSGIGSAGNDFAGLQIGTGGQALQLTQPVALTSAFLNATGPSINFPIFFEFAPGMSNTNPWDGTFAGNSLYGGFFGVPGLGIESFDLTMQVSAVPLPTAVWGGLAVMGMMVAGRALKGRRQL